MGHVLEELLCTCSETSMFWRKRTCNVWKELKFQTNSPHFCIHSVNAVSSKLKCAFVKFSQVWCKNASAHEKVNLVPSASVCVYVYVRVRVCLCMCGCAISQYYSIFLTNTVSV